MTTYSHKSPANIDEIVVEQEKFLKAITLTTHMLRAFKNNPLDFEFLFSRKILEKYKFPSSFRDHPDWVWEALDELAYDIIHRHINVYVKCNGIFCCIDIALPKKKKANEEELNNYFSGCKPGWSI